MTNYQHKSKGGKGLPSNENRDRGMTGTAMPHENERSRVSQPQPQQPKLPVAALRELTKTILHRSSSSGTVSSRRKNDDVKQLQRQPRYSYSNSNSSNREDDRNGKILESSLYEQNPFGSRAQAQAKVKSSPTSHMHHWEPYYNSDHISPPLPPLPFVVDVKRSHPPKRGKSKGINLNDLQPPQPQPKRMSQSTQSSESESDADVSFQRPSPSPSPSNQGRSEEDEATSQLRKMCRDIVLSAEQGAPPTPRAQIKKVIAEYHLSHNNPISPRDPNFTEIPPEFSQILSYGIARSQTQTVQQSTIDPNNQLTRRSRFAESYATKKILGDQG